MSQPSKTPLLDLIRTPDDLRKLEVGQLKQLADELRTETIDAVSVTGGHLGAGLGVIELTVALHYVFDTPRDPLVWDVGHQAYPHKILTGRRDRIRTLRMGDGLSGFTKRAESEYDPFGAAHSSTSISSALGMAVARDLAGGNNNCIAVIGDGALSAGMAYEAMNNAGAMDSRLIVILNDNDMSIAPPVGAMSAYLSRLLSGKTYLKLRDIGMQLAERLPTFMEQRARRVEEYARGFLTGGTLFEELGFYYVGPIDGHNLDHLIPVLRNVRDAQRGPILVHVVTQKGKGYAPAEASADKYHGVVKFDVITGVQAKAKSNAPAYQKVFGESLIKEAQKDEKIIGITAAMPSGTGIDLFAKAFPKRTFDVGIAEQHAVTFAAGLATQGFKPFCAIYSTFLQRAYDQVVHDVAIQSLPVRFAMDRAGLVGADGPTHAGSFDVAYLGCLPNFVIMAAADEADMVHMVATQVAINDRPSALRYPRGEGVGVEMPTEGKPLEIGKGRIIREGSKIALLSLGTRLAEALKAAEELASFGLSTTVADARFAKPLDTDLVLRLANEHEVLITIEEGSIGGFGSYVLQALAEHGALDRGLKVRAMVLPDMFIDQDSPAAMYARAGLDAKSIVKKVFEALGKDIKAETFRLASLTDRLVIARLAHRGEGIADTPAGFVYVPYTLPGETVEVERVPGHPERGHLLRVDTPSAERIEAFCQHFGVCGGCAIQHWTPERYREWKHDLVVAALRQAGLDAPVEALIDAHGEGRRRATFHARRSQRDVIEVGFAALRAHQVVAIDRCPVLAPSLDGALKAAWAIAEHLKNERKPLDIQVTASDAGLDIDVRGSGALNSARSQNLAQLAETHRLARLTRHGELVAQRATPTIAIGRAHVALPPGGFLQATAAGEAILAELVTSYVGAAKKVADLFCGIGPFALRLAERARVTAIDQDEAAIVALKQAVATSSGLKPIEAQARDLFRRPLVAAELKGVDAVVFDPPRQGAEAQARELTKSVVPVVVAVSCDAATFARDARILVDGGYRLGTVTPVDQFRHSAHVEIVAKFER